MGKGYKLYEKKYQVEIEYAKGGNWRNRGYVTKTIDTDFKWYLDQEIKSFERAIEKANNIILSTTIKRGSNDK